MRRAAVSLVLVLAACTIDEVPLEGKRCPCAAGWVCNERGVCVEHGEAGTPDAGVVDASSSDTGMDAGRAEPDAGEPIDAATPDASAADAPPPDAGPDPTECDDALAGALICNGFETGLGGWDPVEMSGTVAAVDSPTYLGGGALHGVVSAGFGRAGAAAYFTPVSTGELWFRGYFYLPSSVALSDTLSLVYVFQDVAPDYPGIATGVTPTGGPFVWSSSEGHTPGTGSSFPRDTWVCVQLGVVISSAAGEVIVKHDGVEVQHETGIDTAYAGAYESVVTGAERAGTGLPAVEVYADEVAVGTSPLPCD